MAFTLDEKQGRRLMPRKRVILLLLAWTAFVSLCSLITYWDVRAAYVSEKDRVKMASGIVAAFEQDFSDPEWATRVAESLATMLDVDEERKEKFIQVVVNKLPPPVVGWTPIDFELEFPNFWKPTTVIVELYNDPPPRNDRIVQYVNIRMARKDDAWLIDSLSIGYGPFFFDDHAIRNAVE